jgi:hypothetical protein
MPVNHADMITLGTFVCSPVIAGMSAASAHAGWLTPLFMVGGLVAGFGVSYLVRTVSYGILNLDVKAHPWLEWLSMICYMLVPVLVAAAGLAGIAAGADWLARHLG